MLVNNSYGAELGAAEPGVVGAGGSGQFSASALPPSGSTPQELHGMPQHVVQAQQAGYELLLASRCHQQGALQPPQVCGWGRTRCIIGEWDSACTSEALIEEEAAAAIGMHKH